MCCLVKETDQKEKNTAAQENKIMLGKKLNNK